MLIDDVFTDLVRDANGRATMKLMYNGKELHVSLGPKFKTVLAWSTPLPGGGGGRWAVGADAAPVPGAARATAPAFGSVPVDPAQGVRSRRRLLLGRRCARADDQGLRRVRADGRHHQRAEPRAQRRLQGTADIPPGGLVQRASGSRRRATERLAACEWQGSWRSSSLEGLIAEPGSVRQPGFQRATNVGHLSFDLGCGMPWPPPPAGE